MYVHSFSRAGRMKAGFELYRAFEQDDKDVKENIAKFGKIKLPVLATGGDKSELTLVRVFARVDCRARASPADLLALSQYSEQMASELADNVTFAAIKNSSHWVPEESPDDLVSQVLGFLGKSVT